MKVKSEIERQEFMEGESNFVSLFGDSSPDSSAEAPVIRKAFTSPTQTVKRDGRILYQLNSGYQSSEVPLQTLGPTPDRWLQFYGAEPASDLPERKGAASDVYTFDAIREIQLVSRDLQHPDGRTRVFATTPTMTGLWVGARVQGGDRVIDVGSHVITSARVYIECTYSNRFVFGTSPSEETYLGWVIPDTWVSDASEPNFPRIIGNSGLIVLNATRNRVLYTRNNLDAAGGHPGSVVLAAIEWEIRKYYAPFINDGDLVEVQLIHKAFCLSWGTAEVNYVGAGTGFTLLPVTLK